MRHIPLGVTENGLSFEFELDDGDGFVHFRHELCGTGESRVVLEVFGLPDRTGIIAVNGHGEVG